MWNGRAENRYILGGWWNAPAYIYTDPDAADPWSRQPENARR